MMKRSYSSIVAIGMFLCAILLPACSNKGKGSESGIETAEGVAADMTAEQMEAWNAGRNAAGYITGRNWGKNDSMKLQEAILDARAQSSQYEMKGDSKSKALFDSAFFDAIRTARPDLADKLHPEIPVKRDSVSNSGVEE